MALWYDADAPSPPHGLMSGIGRNGGTPSFRQTVATCTSRGSTMTRGGSSELVVHVHKFGVIFIFAFARVCDFLARGTVLHRELAESRQRNFAAGFQLVSDGLKKRGDNLGDSAEDRGVAAWTRAIRSAFIMATLLFFHRVYIPKGFSATAET